MRCVSEVREVQVMTYGLENDDLAWVREQKCMGCSGVIADDLASVISGLAYHMVEA
jgi:hypothetical protein